MIFKQKLHVSAEVSSFYKAVMQMAGSRLLIIVLSFVGSVILTRTIGPDGRGIMAWFVAAASLAMMFAQCGIEVVNRRYVAEQVSRAGGMAIFTLKVCLLGSLAVTPFFLYFAFTSDIGPANLDMLVATYPSIFLMAAASCLGGVLLGLNKVKSYALSSAFQKIFNVVTILLLLPFGLLTPLMALWSLTLSYLVQVGMSLLQMRKELKARTKVSWEFLKEIKGYALYNHGRGLLSMAATSLVPILLAQNHTLGSAGLFAACMILIDAISKTFGSINTYALPRLASLNGKEGHDRAHLRKTVQKLNLVGMFVIASMGILTAGWTIPLLYGEEFRAAVFTFQILCAYMFFLNWFETLQTLMIAESKSPLMLAAPLVRLALVVGLGLVLIPQMGAQGGALVLLAGTMAGVLCAGSLHMLMAKGKIK